MTYDIPALDAIAREVERRGGTTDEVLASLRDAGASPIASMQVLCEIRGISVGDAKRVVWSSPIWSDRLPAQVQLERDVLAVSAGMRLASYLTPYGPPDPDGLDEAATALGFEWPQDFAAFMSITDGGEGWVGASFLSIRRAEELLSASVQEFEPDLVVFGSNGGGEGFAYDKSVQPPVIVMVPLIGLDDPIPQGHSLDEFVDRLLADALFTRPEATGDVNRRQPM
jgi:hypothetical protein